MFGNRQLLRPISPLRCQSRAHIILQALYGEVHLGPFSKRAFRVYPQHARKRAVAIRLGRLLRINPLYAFGGNSIQGRLKVIRCLHVLVECDLDTVGISPGFLNLGCF